MQIHTFMLILGRNVKRADFANTDSANIYSIKLLKYRNLIYYDLVLNDKN